MSLRTLVESLQAIPADELKRAGAKLAEKRVVYPADCEDGEVELRQLTKRGKDTKDSLLCLRGSLKKTLSETAPLLDNLFEQTRSLKLAPRAFEVDLGMYWPTATFTQEQDLGDLTEVNVFSSFDARDPTKTRIGFPYKGHHLDVELKGRSMQISTKGDYSALLPRIISELKPQLATIRLSASDAQRWLNKTKGRFRKWLLKRALKPKKRNYIALQIGGGVSFDEKEEIETTITASMLSACADAIGKPLINEVTGKQTFVVSLTKLFLWKSQILPALQSVVRIIGELKTKTIFDYPLLTISQAKEMLDKEIDLVRQSYEQFLFFGQNTHMMRGPLVKRLAQEHFGDNIVVPFDEMDAPQYLAFLQSRGFDYTYETNERNESPYILKEMYLLRFFRQSFTKDPRNSIEQFRRFYINPAPMMWIRGSGIRTDAARIANVSLPTQALLWEFGIKGHSSIRDDLVNITRISNNLVNFQIGILLDSYKLLDLQDEVCKSMGVVCY